MTELVNDIKTGIYALRIMSGSYVSDLASDLKRWENLLETMDERSGMLDDSMLVMDACIGNTRMVRMDSDLRDRGIALGKKLNNLTQDDEKALFGVKAYIDLENAHHILKDIHTQLKELEKTGTLIFIDSIIKHKKRMDKKRIRLVSFNPDIPARGENQN